MTRETPDGESRIAFAHNLRGIAAISVLICHLVGVFWTSPEMAAQLLGLLVIPVATPQFVPALHSAQWFNFGTFGVALFFLISGFVIPFSFRSLSTSGFLLARSLRIYPTYATCLGIGVAWMYLLHLHFSPTTPFGVSAKQFAIQALLVRGWLWVPSLDGLSWTLEIEVVFYVVMALLHKITYAPRLTASVLCGFAVANMVATATVGHLIPSLSGLQAQALELTFITPFLSFMLIGTVLHHVLAGTIRPGTAILLGGVLWLSFFFSASVTASLGTVNFASYAFAGAVFVAFFLTRSSFPEVRILSWVADISYPLYAVHALLGYGLLYLLSGYGWPPLCSLAATLAVVLGVAWGVHLTIETASTRLGKALAKHCFPPANGAAPALPVSQDVARPPHG